MLGGNVIIMSPKKFWNGLLHCLSLILIFLLSIYVCWNIIALFEPYLLKIIANSSGIDSKIAKDIFAWLSRILDTIIGLIITAIVKIKIDEWQSYPCVLIAPRQTQGKGVSGIKKETNLLHSPKIMIGEKKAEYRIIYATITNVGKVQISKCQINKQPFLSLFVCQETKNFVFVLYDLFDGASEKEYIFPYELWDEKDRKYSGLYSMKVNISNCKVTFSKHKKLKKVFVKNALSDL